MANLGSNLATIFLPKKKNKPGGNAFTNTFNPSATQTALSVPQYRDHTTDIFTQRTSQDSRALINDLIKFDSDMSAALHAYLTVANTTPRFYVYDEKGELDKKGMVTLEGLINSLSKRYDYTTGFEFTKSLREVAEDFRYMILARGGIGAELVFNKLLLPDEVRSIDLSTIQWFEQTPGVYKPHQRPAASPDPIILDIPTFFVKFYRQNPMEIYTHSIFVSSINTIATRQQVINDLYRIMQKTGYPRIDITVVEEVLRKNAPADVRANENQMSSWLNARMAELGGLISNMRPDTAFVHSDAVEATILNEKGPGASLDASAIIDVLNSQNQSGLKTMATIIGRGESGVNTASVEARVFSMNADSLNGPIADMFSDMFTLALRLTGYAGYVECCFDKVELRPSTELEPQLVMKQSRLLQDLSLGIITDDHYYIEMYGTAPPDGAQQLSGTGFMQTQPAGVDAGKVSPNSDPLGRSVATPGAKSAKSNTVKKAG